ncbi:MAG: hypothetical protein AVO33_10640 [delta proteobacterium ML8_F1]|nr:MAG: hypothetical protein AVO33_10640 [delta proteobacterium ML8_F1]
MKEFNGMEILNLLVESEGKVAQLYTDMAGKTDHDKAKNLFMKLAGDELNHQKMYEALMADLDQDLKVELEDEDYEYIDSMIRYNYFRTEAVRDKDVKENALMVAEKVERDAVMLVQEVMELFPKVAPKEMKKILKEEKKHLKYVLQSQQDAMVKNLML